MSFVLGQKVLAGIVTLTAVLFSSYKGNDADFAQISTRRTGDYLIVRTQLENSFENDFQELFESGKQVDVWFNLETKDPGNGRVLLKSVFRHSVKYDPLTSEYKIYLQEQKRTMYCKTFGDSKDALSKVEISILVNPQWSQIRINLESYLKKMHFESTGKEFDLMALWKLKRPNCSAVTDVRVYEN